MLGLMLHAKARDFIVHESYAEALEVLIMAEVSDPCLVNVNFMCHIPCLVPKSIVLFLLASL
jgi:hypothetical protein